jgi:hypothetical protein
MEIDAMMADSVVVAEGKLYLQGAGWNQITAAQVPCVHDRVGLAIIIRVPYTATNQTHQLEIGLVGEDGAEVPLGAAPPGAAPEGESFITKIGAQFNVGRPATIEAGDDQMVPFGMNLNGLKFDSVGQYSFVISIDQTEMERLTFRVNQQLQPMRVLSAGGGQ